MAAIRPREISVDIQICMFMMVQASILEIDQGDSNDYTQHTFIIIFYPHYAIINSQWHKLLSQTIFHRPKGA